MKRSDRETLLGSLTRPEKRRGGVPLEHVVAKRRDGREAAKTFSPREGTRER